VQKSAFGGLPTGAPKNDKPRPACKEDNSPESTEEGCLSMRELAFAMKQDAARQNHLVPKICRILDKAIIAGIGRSRSGHASLLAFESSTPCPLLPTAFIGRMMQYGSCSPCCLLVGVVYLQKINLQTGGDLIITSFNIQRLLLTAVMLASKFLDDYYCNNKQWALIGGLPTAELNRLELKMLTLLDFSVSISSECYNGCMDALNVIDADAAKTSDRGCGSRSAPSVAVTAGHIRNARRPDPRAQASPPSDGPGPISLKLKTSPFSQDQRAHFMLSAKTESVY
jgi:hypothetical protein